ncbi:dTTP/UTP pyrophosphatase [Belonocnema kinseyi]|uniref:dTTP/UTP pyrophosphatase n=1 Tax=Belonocnema kinseyi TaxID=2817044 RepID=UPI00143DA53A|nr:dTTP/UTP pyrophosphatase [Belonocnema kinseyi]
MLEPAIQALSAGRIILASSSPRRQEIIQKLGFKVEIVPSFYNENLDRSKYNSHSDYIQDLARFKVLDVFERLEKEKTPPELIIGADTLVTLGDVIYGKPKDEQDAFKMLSCLNNKTHTVYTGVCLKTRKTEIKFYESAEVKFGDLSEDQIKAYIRTGEPLDKAGGYGIQGLGGCLVEKINGDFYTVMGMPLYSTVKHLNKLSSEL